VSAYHQSLENIKPESIVYIDEMGIDAFIYREYAYSKRGVKVIGHISGKNIEERLLLLQSLTKTLLPPYNTKALWILLCLSIGLNSV